MCMATRPERKESESYIPSAPTNIQACRTGETADGIAFDRRPEGRQGPSASLTIRTYPDDNHNLQRARTGGLREMLQMNEHRASDGYYEAMADWLRTKVL